MNTEETNGSETAGHKETPEQLAAAISDALQFLQGEADAAGMSELSKRIGHALAAADALTRPGSAEK